MAEFYDFDRANARLPELRDLLLSLQALKGEVAQLRDRIVELNAPVIAAAAAGMAPDAAVTVLAPAASSLRAVTIAAGALAGIVTLPAIAVHDMVAVPAP